MKSLFSKVRVTEIGPLEAQQRGQGHTAIMVDVRQRDEWRGGHIPEAKHIPLGELQTRMHELPRDSDIIFVCKSGSRSTTATKALIQAGRSNVASLTGGMQAWKQAGLPVER